MAQKDRSITEPHLRAEQKVNLLWVILVFGVLAGGGLLSYILGR